MSPIQGLRPEKLRELVLLILIALVLIVFSSVIENYLNARLFNRVSASVALMAVLAIGQTMVVLTRNIDLSVGSIVGFTAYFVGHQLSQYGDMHPLLAIFLAVGVGTLMGGINGILVAYCRIPSIIVTLGTMALYRTLLVEYSDAQTVLTVNLPRWLLDLPSLNLISFDRLHLRVLVVGMIVVVVLFPNRSQIHILRSEALCNWLQPRSSKNGWLCKSADGPDCISSLWCSCGFNRIHVPSSLWKHYRCCWNRL